MRKQWIPGPFFFGRSGLGTRLCGASISPREARKKIFTLTFQLSGWALVAPSCFALQVQYVRGLMLQRDVLSGEGGPEPGAPVVAISAAGGDESLGMSLHN